MQRLVCFTEIWNNAGVTLKKGTTAEKMAEEERFELSNGFPSPVFKTGAFSHSATPPQTLLLKPP